jgi:hypothetical protein
MKLTSDAMGDLFQVPESTWTTIDNRVNLTFLAALEFAMAILIPTFRELLGACITWRYATFPQLVTLSQSVVDYAGQAISNFDALRQAIAGLDPDAALPPDVERQAKQVLGQLASSTGALDTQVAASASSVMAFAAVNQAVDAQIEDYIAALGPAWQSIATEIGNVDRAVGSVEGAWMAIADDLSAIADDQITITLQFLLDLDIQVALRSWDDLRAEAKAFARFSGGPQYDRSGRSSIDSRSAAGIDLPRAGALTGEELRRALLANGISLSDEELARLLQAIR